MTLGYRYVITCKTMSETLASLINFV
ncbi:Extracellular calcium-sensing receptor [Gossypium arboreum]|uniref:Extracellular calcium-sensing receptor n=1 Tax=Gossypium arboreum TaxID=29729 RepID=A0A0B0NE71_GOSAR|nr:Extracellular calcium-sensing receptor [Gossypium arboreum]